MKLIKKNVLFWLLMAVVIAGCNEAVQMNEEDGVESTATGKTDVSDVATDAKDGEKDPTSLEEPTSLNGTKWKLAGIVDTQTGDMMEPDEPDCKVRRMGWGSLDSNTMVVLEEWECFSLEFKNDGWVHLATSSNYGWSMYTVDVSVFEKDKDILLRSIQLVPGGTKIGETDFGYLFVKALSTVKFFSLKENELRLYYNDNNNFLLFKSLKNHE